MDIDGPSTFVAIAETRRLHAGRARLHRSQPAISRRLGLLEQELGAPLFDRMRGRARLTEAGRAFRPHAEAALAALKDGQEAVRDLQSGLQGSLSLALVGTLADTHIVDTLRRFRRRARERAARAAHRLERGGDRPGAARRGRRSACATSLADGPISSPMRPARRRCWWWRPRAIGWPAAACAASRRLRGERWIGFPPVRNERDSSGHLLARQLVRAGLDDADVTLIDSLTAQKRLAQAGFGLALVPESSVRDELRQGLLVALDVPAMRAVNPITAIHRRNGYLSPAAKALAGAADQQAAEAEAASGGSRRHRRPL